MCGTAIRPLPRVCYLGAELVEAGIGRFNPARGLLRAGTTSKPIKAGWRNGGQRRKANENKGFWYSLGELNPCFQIENLMS